MFFDSFSFDGETFGIDKRVPTELKSKLDFAGDTKRWNYMKATEEFVFIGGYDQLCQVCKEFFILSNQKPRSILFLLEKRLDLRKTELKMRMAYRVTYMKVPKK